MRVLLVLIISVFASQATAGDMPNTSFPGLAETMSDEAYANAGLHKLSTEERVALDAWLARYLAGERDSVREVTKQELERVRQTPSDERIDARILPPFTGWEGETVFRLNNGQIWRQRLQGRYRHGGSVSAEGVAVVISRNFFGFYVLELSEAGRSVGVERLR